MRNPTAAMRPNLVFILTDHFRRDALGSHTPHLLRLANSGVRFANAYCASPLCMPSRNCIISGLTNAQTGICGNQAEPFNANLRGQTFMHGLRAAGYTTALTGKHHFIDQWGLGVDVCADDALIREYGFDHVEQVMDDGENAHNDDAYTAWLKKQGKLGEFRAALAKGGFRHPFPAELSADGYIGARALAYIDQHDGRQPFYLNVGFIGPHPPFWHPGELTIDPATMAPPLGVPDTEATRLKRAHYLEKCALIDGCVGRLVEAVKRRGWLDNTIFIFTSDHGDCLGDFDIWDKRWFYENSVGVPLFLSGPGIPASVRSNGPLLSKALVTHLDLYPTMLELAGAPAPAEPPRRTGRSLLATLRRDAGAGHTEIFAELGTAVMVRTASWKLVFDPEAGGVQQLFNLASDPNELINLAGVAGYEAATAELLARLLGDRIRLNQYTHAKEEQRVQRVRLPN